MRKIRFLTVQIIALGCLVCACGSKGTDSNTESEYVSKGFAVEAGEISTETEEDEFDLSSITSVVGELQESELKLIKDTDIYSKPDKNSSKLGSWEKDTTVKVLGKITDTDWLMIRFNGRVAYVTSDSFDQEDEETVSSVDVPRNNSNRNNSSNSGNSSNNGSNSGNSTGNNSGTGVNNTTNTGNGSGNTTGGNSGSNNGGSSSGTGTSSGDNSSGGTGNTEEPDSPSSPDTPSDKPSTPDDSGNTENPTDPEPSEPDNPQPSEPDTEPQPSTENLAEG